MRSMRAIHRESEFPICCARCTNGEPYLKLVRRWPLVTLTLVMLRLGHWLGVQP